MADAQDALRDAWLGGPEDRLCGREQAKAWALRAVWRDDKKGDHGLYAYVASKVRKTRKGKPTGGHPCGEAMKEFFVKIDADPDWYPGKHCGSKRGPDPVLVGGKKTGVIQACKKMKRENKDVTYPAIVPRCEAALLNPATGEPVHKKAFYRVLREYNPDPDDPDEAWDLRPRLSREALTEPQIQRRFAWVKWMEDEVRHTPAWFYLNLVWTDICNSILPMTTNSATAQAQARKADQFWGSKSEQEYSANLRGSKKHIKMKSSDTMRVWFVPILVQGKFHIEVLPSDFPGETEAGAATLVAKVRAALNIRFQSGSAPSILFTDRGNGFFDSGSGNITVGYRDALRRHSLKAFMRSDASMQPGSLQEIMLHETAMAWVRLRLSRTVPIDAHKETVPEYTTRLKEVAAYINANYDVEGLCRGLPGRLQRLRAAKGDRIGS